MSDEVLSEVEATGLRWMATLNKDGVGFLGPSVIKSGPLAEYERLVKLKLASVEWPRKWQSEAERYSRRSRSGYWITANGAEALGRLRGKPAGNPQPSPVI